jgi:hypothetical protein
MLRTLIGTLEPFIEAFGIFAVSMIVLFAFYTINTTKATGIVWFHVKGLVLISVGVLYIICGAFLMHVHR